MDQVSNWINLSLIWAQLVKNPPAVKETQEAQFTSLCHEDPLEKEMAIHSSILDQDSPWGRKESNTTEWLSAAQGWR